jgi:hypothetical protein
MLIGGVASPQNARSCSRTARLCIGEKQAPTRRACPSPYPARVPVRPRSQGALPASRSMGHSQPPADQTPRPRRPRRAIRGRGAKPDDHQHIGQTGWRDLQSAARYALAHGAQRLVWNVDTAPTRSESARS